MASSCAFFFLSSQPRRFLAVAHLAKSLTIMTCKMSFCRRRTPFSNWIVIQFQTQSLQVGNFNKSNEILKRTKCLVNYILREEYFIRHSTTMPTRNPVKFTTTATTTTVIMKVSNADNKECNTIRTI